MTQITASVGARAVNNRADVATVQTLLNARISALGVPALRTDGRYTPETLAAIRIFQLRVMGSARADGRVDPGGRTMLALADVSSMRISQDVARATAAAARLSGAAWFAANQANFPNSSSVSDLTPVFGRQVGEFLTALRNAHASVTISATRRNRTRAWLMHYSWRLAHDDVAPADIPVNPDCDIIWDHGDPAETKRAAQEMVRLFGIAFRPSLTSNHIAGTAIDMTISWSAPIEIADAAGRRHRIDQPRSGATNEALRTIGRSYGVIKLASDPPHWSADGH